jgi:hypothetical protein
MEAGGYRDMPIFPGAGALCAVAAVVTADILWIRHAGLGFPLLQLTAPTLEVALLLAGALGIALVLRRLEGPAPAVERIMLLLQGLAFLQVAMIAIRILNHASMTSALPWADARLASWDAALGLDWKGYFRFVQARPWLVHVLDASYDSLDRLAVMGFLLLAVHRESRRSRFFVETFLATAILCTLIGPLFPARAAVATHIGVLPTFVNFPGPPGLYHLEALERLRSDAPGTLDIAQLSGLVTFPSFHTAAGILLAVGFWRTSAFPLVAAYVSVMIAATPVFGGHYFVDLIAGTVLAAAVVMVFAALPGYRGLFDRACPPGAVAPSGEAGAQPGEA